MKQNSKCFELILNYNCNARCVFCSQGMHDKAVSADFRVIAENIYSARKAGYSRLGLTGGEPLMRPDLKKIITLGKKAGFDYIRMQTNGIKLADADLCRDLVKAGLTFCKFSFTTDDEKLHDRLVGVKGAWRSALTGAESLVNLKIRLGNNILVNRLNYRRLPEIINFFINRGITNFVIIYPVYTGSMAEGAREKGVSLPECAPYFEEAIQLMSKKGLGDEILFLNVPPCFLRESPDLAIGANLFNTVVTDPEGAKTDLDKNAGAAKKYSPVCGSCAYNKPCGGVDASYSAIWGFGGFKPLVKKTKHRILRSTGEGVLSDNDKCLLEILKLKSEASTTEVLQLSKKIALCRNCSDGNAVMAAAHKLIKKKLVESRFYGGKYYWRLKL